MTLIHGISEQYTIFNDGTFLMDALTDFVALRFFLRTTAPVLKVEWFCNTKSGTPGNMGVVLVDDIEGVPEIDTGVPVDIGGGSPTLVTLAAADVTGGARHTATLTNGYTPTAGDYIWVVLYPIDGTWDGSNRYSIRVRFTGVGNDYGHESKATSTNTGTSWTRDLQGCGYCSLLTTGDAYIQTFANCCLDGETNTDFDDADNPDERGVAWTIPASTVADVSGGHNYLRPSALTADFNLGCYLGDSSQASLAINTSKVEVAAGADKLATLLFLSDIQLTAGTGRVAVKATHASDTIRFSTLNFGTQARRESCLAFRDYWYCTQNAGGGFTDDLTRIPSILPIVEHYGSGGGGAGEPANLHGGVHQ